MKSSALIPAGQVCTFTAGASVAGGVVQRLPDAAGGPETYTPASLAASATLVVGPFNTARRYSIVTDAGEITHALTPGEVYDPSAVAITGGTISGANVSDKLVGSYASDGAIAKTSGIHKLTKTSAGAYTLAAPVAAEEGMTLEIVAGTAFAHVLTATNLLDDGVTGGAKDTATFGAFVGASLTLKAVGLTWYVISKNVVTIAAV